MKPDMQKKVLILLGFFCKLFVYFLSTSTPTEIVSMKEITKLVRIDDSKATKNKIAQIKDYLRVTSGIRTITEKRAIEFAINMAIDMIAAEREINE